MFSFTAMCSLGSLALGFAAWIFPVMGILRAQKDKRWQHLSLVSMALCAFSLQLQLECAANWARGEDVPALLDCCNAQAFAGRVLLAVALALNLTAFLAAQRAPGEGRP